MSVKRRGVRHELTIPAGPVRAKYKDFVFNEGFKEMAMIGTFNTSKCLVPDAKIRTSRGLVRLDSVQVGDLVATRAGYRRVEDVISGGVKPVFEVLNENGQRLRATAEHKVLTRDGWRRVGDLVAGDRMVVQLGDDAAESFDPWGYFLGLFTGDGNRDIRSGGRLASYVHITNMEPEVDRFFSEWMEPAGYSVKRYAKPGTQAVKYTLSTGLGGRWEPRGSSRPPQLTLRDQMLEWGVDFKLAHEKRVPERVLASSADTRRAFLQGLFDTDGYVDVRQGTVGLSVASLGLALDVQTMLLDFGVPSKVKSYNNDRQGCHVVSMGGWNAHQFGERIGFRVARKQALIRPGQRRPNRSVRRDDQGCVYPRVVSVEPCGESQVWDLTVEDRHEFIAEGVVVHNSTALVDWLITSGIEYPGANLVLTRAKLSDLRRTTLTKFLSRAGTVLVDDYNKNEAVIHFPEINGKVSKLYMFGLDRTDLDEVLKSFEPFRAAVEEANEVPSRALDLLLGRLRQKVEHRYRTWEWYAREMASLWGVSEERARVMLGVPKERLQEPHLGANQLKYVFNPEGNDAIWRRCVGVPYPPPDQFSREWVRENVGVREFVIPPEEVGSYSFQAGNLVELPGGVRAFAAGEGDDESGQRVVELADGSFVPKSQVSFVGQRAAIFVFTDENWSRNVKSDENFLYMQDPAIREQYFEGRIDVRKGLLFPGFDRITHVAPPPKAGLPAGLRVHVGLDQGMRHPTVALLAVETRKPAGGLYVFKEYVASGRPASENAYLIRGLVPPDAESVQYWADPSMWVVDATSGRSVADDYFTAGVPLMRAENAVERTVDGVRDYLRPEIDWLTGDERPRLFISSDCEQLIHAIETCTTQHLFSSRDNWIVDVVDALRYLVSGASRLVVPDEVVPRAAKPRVWDFT